MTLNRTKTLVAALFLTLAPGAVATPGETRIPLFGRTLAFQLPKDFVQVHNANNGTNVLIEYVPRGETVANWTRMVTVQAYRGLGASPRSSADIAQQAFAVPACRIGPIYHYIPEKNVSKTLRRSIIVNGCASLPAGAYPKALAGAGEQDFILMFRDAQTIYTLNYAVRGAPFSGKPPPVKLEDAETFLQQVVGNVRL